jgi:hypothetical protein
VLEPLVIDAGGAGPKPRLVKLEIRKTGVEPFWSGSLRCDTIHYILKVDLKGFA